MQPPHVDFRGQNKVLVFVTMNNGKNLMKLLLGELLPSTAGCEKASWEWSLCLEAQCTHKCLIMWFSPQQLFGKIFLFIEYRLKVGTLFWFRWKYAIPSTSKHWIFWLSWPVHSLIWCMTTGGDFEFFFSLPSMIIFVIFECDGMTCY